MKIIGNLLLLVAFLDFMGMFLSYDFTGVPWSPIAFSIVGGLFLNGSETQEQQEPSENKLQE